MGQNSWTFKRIIANYGVWAALFIAPLLVNLLVWAAVVAPQRRALQTWRETSRLSKLKPQFETLLTQSHQVLAQWRQTSFTKEDPSAVMQDLRRLAGKHHVQIQELNSMASSASVAAGSSSMPLELNVTGRFSTLAHWMSEIENQGGFLVESWTLAPESEAAGQCQLSVKMTAFLREA